MDVVMSVEDKIKLKLAEQTRSDIQSQIDKQTERKARLECQILLMKLQLAEEIEKTEKMKRQALARVKEI